MTSNLEHHTLIDCTQPNEVMRRSSALLRVGKQSATPGYGLFTVVDRDSDDWDITDIVAIHGLNGHFEKTWTTEGTDGARVNWLRDLLPKKLPNTRILAFSYNYLVQSGNSTAGILDFATQLLEEILTVRKTPAEKARPIVFVCHSLGGIVCKQV